MVSVINMMDLMQFRWGQEGYLLYKELHQNYYSGLVHAMFMPLVVYSVFVGLPPLLTSRAKSYLPINLLIHFLYTAYYLTFDPMGAFLSALVYGQSLYLAYMTHQYYRDRRWLAVRYGLIGLVVGLVVQETVGHTLLEGANSDLTQIPNSIAIAPIFASNSLFGRS